MDRRLDGWARVWAVGLVAVVLAGVVPAGVSAAPKALLTTVGGGSAGQGGVFANARGIGVNHSTGDFYVADGNNHRVQQFTADGVFVRAWGFDVDSANPGTGFEVCAVAADCKSGVNGPAAGQVGGPYGVAVDQSNGFVYVASQANRRIDVFSGSGQFAGAFGWDVDPAGIVGLEVCTAATGCKAAVAGSSAGQLGNLFLSFLGIDPSAPAGTVYVPDYANARVAKYKAEVSGGVLQSVSFVKAFGWDVAPGAVDEEQEVRVRATAGQFTLSFGGDTTADLDHDATAGEVETALNALGSVSAGGGSVTVSGGPGDETGSDLYVVRFGGGPLAGTDVAQLTAANGTTPLSGGDPSSTATVQTRANGGTSTELESCTTASGCKAGTTGNGSGQFTGNSPAAQAGSPRGAAVDSTGAVYVTSGPLQGGNNACSAAFPCRIQKFDPSTTSATDFGPVSGDGLLTQTTGTVGTVAGIDVAVDPANDHVYVNQKTGTTSYVVREYTETGDLVETHPTGGLTSGTTTVINGIAAGTDERVYTNMTGTSVYVLGDVPDPTPTIGAVTDVTATKATFNGTVEIPAPGAPTFNTTYRFEYSSNGIDWAANSDQQPGDGTTGVHAVSHVVGGLQPNTLYQVRLVASTGSEPVVSATTTFTTQASAPRVAMTYVDEVTQTTARLGAHIDPEGLPASYHFEWGAEPCSDVPNPCTSVPGFERQIGGGNTPVIVNEFIDGLDKETTYHYRVVATNSEDPTHGPDQTFETLNDCDLTNNRCYELASPPDKGPVGSAGDVGVLGLQLAFQVAPMAPAIAYTMAYGLPDSTSGVETVYRADRDGDGWSSSQLSPPALAVSNRPEGDQSRTQLLSSDLSCGISESDQPLVEGGPTAALDAGRQILYRRDASGEFTPIPAVDPLNSTDVPATSASFAVGVSEDPDGSCDRVVFASWFRYPGVPGAGTWRLYLWDDGELSNIGEIPGPGGPEAVEAAPGAPNILTGELSVAGDRSRNYWNAVSDDASRIFFSANRLTSPQAAEIGQIAVFVRIDGNSTGIDVSQSQTATPNNGPSRYQTASTDGDYVLFTAKSGLADNDASAGPATCSAGSGGQPDGPGCDLYRYSVEDGTLTDLSVPGDGSNAGGAGVTGVIGASDDASHVYFAARGQLVPGEGPSESQNLADDNYSVYLSETSDAFPDGELKFVGTISSVADDHNALLSSSTQNTDAPLQSRVTPDGEHLLFASRTNVTGYVSDGRPQAYLYSVESDTIVCVSCRRDGKPPAGPVESGNLSLPVPLTSNGSVVNVLSPPRSLTDDGRRVFFMSYSRLAVGAVEGQRSLYQWDDGQITFLAASAPSTGRRELRFAGASRYGDDIYFTTVDKYTWQDVDAKLDVYDARVGGGFAAPAAPAAPCDPLAGGCQGGAFDAVPTDPKTSSSTENDNAAAERRKTLALYGLSKKARKRAARRGVLPIRLRTSSAGRVRLTAKAKLGKRAARVGRKTVRIREAGVTRVNLRLNSRARKRLRSGKRLRVTIQVRQRGARTRTRSALLPGVRR